MLNLKDYIRNIPDFPKPGIIFRDITTALKKPDVFRQIIDEIYFNFKDENIDYIAAIESRGYLFGAPLAYKLGAGLVIIRKPGKLPSKVERIEYELEYGTDSLEIHQDREKGFWLSTICLLPEEQFAQPANLLKK